MQPSDRHPHNYAPRFEGDFLPDALTFSDWLAIAAPPVALPVGLHYGLELLRGWIG
jgi:hypothetical protein